MDLQLTGKVAIVTGGNSGIGRSIAITFAREGAAVVIAARGAEKGMETVAMIEKQGGRCLFVQTDVSQAADVAAMVDRTLSTFGRLDCAVNNAAIEGQKPFLDWTEDEWDETIDINLKGVWLCLKHQIRPMLQQGGGAIVNISSVAGLIGFPMHAPYVAAKHGVQGLTKVASAEFARSGIRVNTICPGVILTPMLEQGFANNPENAQMAVNATAMGRVGQPNELAAAAVWLCSSQASFITGITVAVDGGWSRRSALA